MVFDYFSKITETSELDLLTAEALLDAFNITIKTNKNLIQKLESFAQTKNIKSRIVIARVLAKGNPNATAFKKLSTEDKTLVKVNAALALLQEKTKKQSNCLLTCYQN